MIPQISSENLSELDKYVRKHFRRHLLSEILSAVLYNFTRYFSLGWGTWDKPKTKFQRMTPNDNDNIGSKAPKTQLIHIYTQIR